MGLGHESVLLFVDGVQPTGLVGQVGAVDVRRLLLDSTPLLARPKGQNALHTLATLTHILGQVLLQTPHHRDEPLLPDHLLLHDALDYLDTVVLTDGYVGLTFAGEVLEVAQHYL